MGDGCCCVLQGVLYRSIALGSLTSLLAATLYKWNRDRHHTNARILNLNMNLNTTPTVTSKIDKSLLVSLYVISFVEYEFVLLLAIAIYCKCVHAIKILSIVYKIVLLKKANVMFCFVYLFDGV